jgi:hippurate hydrolase
MPTDHVTTLDIERLTSLRHRLHTIPELNYEEFKTAAVIREELSRLNIEFIDGVPDAPTATIATIGDRSKPCIALRADIDALPIDEQTGVSYVSTHPGRIHACGHDGHTSILIGAAEVLKQMAPQLPVCVKLVFQPAEEGGGGARSMIADGLFQRFPMERIFGWHNWPGLPAGTIAVHDRAVMAAGARFEIGFEGHAGHAALPHLTRDPMIGAGHCIVGLQSIVARNVDPLDSGVIRVTVAEAGEAQNQVPKRAVLKGTLRFLRDETGDVLEDGLRRVAQGIATAFQLEAEVAIRRGVPVTANHPEERELAAAAAGAVTDLRRDMLPAMTGEDFSWFLKEVPGAFVWIGNGPAEGGCELHNPNYDFNDAILPTASTWLAETAKRALSGG